MPRYGDVDKIIEQDGFEIQERLYMVVEGENLITSAKTTGLGLIEYASTFERLKPDCIFIMADRYEQIAAAVAAAYMNIPIAHAQGGEVSGNVDEKVRHAITKLSDIHFPATVRAREWLIRMGENPDKVILSGCPSTDLCQKVMDAPDLDFDLYKKYKGVGAQPDLKKPYLIVMQHPVTTEFGKAKNQINETLKAVSNIDMPALWFWPNIDAGSDEAAKAIRIFREKNVSEKIHFFRNMEPEDFLKVLHGASAIIGNSSCGIRESSYLGVPSVNIGSRQADRERSSNVIDVGYNKIEIEQAIRTHLFRPRPKGVDLYGNGKAAKIIAETLATISTSYQKKLNYRCS